MSIALATKGIISTSVVSDSSQPISVCDPTILSREVGSVHLDGKEIGPSMKVKSVLPNISSPIVEGKVVGSKDVGFVHITPNMKAIMDEQSIDRIIHTFPPPKNT